MKKNIVVALVIFVLTLSACQNTTSHQNTTPNPAENAVPAGLLVFENNQSLESHLRTINQPIPEVVQNSAPDNTDANSQTPEAAAAPQNLVQEGDLYKISDHRLIVWNQMAGLLVYDVSNPAQPKKLGHLKNTDASEKMYVNGNIVSLLSMGSNKVRLYDIEKPENISLRKELSLTGSHQESRQIGSHVYYATIETRSLENNERNTPESTCTKTYLPENFGISGGYYQVWHITHVSLDDLSMNSLNDLCVTGSQLSSVYATSNHFYLTTFNIQTDQTNIILFDISSPQKPAIIATANVPGLLVNQFSMNENGSVLSVASTTNRTTVGPEDNRNYLTTFDISQKKLEKLGQLDSIVPGESITAARFVKDKAFLTTFVTSDPLISIDLADPRTPKILGELHLPGSTSYIESWGDILVAFGQESNWGGRSIVNLFDISDLTHPQLIEQELVEDSYFSEALWNHLAISSMQERSLFSFPSRSFPEESLKVFRINNGANQRGIEEIASIDHSDLTTELENVFYPVLRRSFEIDGFLYTLSEIGMKVYDFNNLNEPVSRETFPDVHSPRFDFCGSERCYPVGD